MTPDQIEHERGLFEVHEMTQWPEGYTREHILTKVKIIKRGMITFGRYNIDKVQYGWEGWLARAELDQGNN